MDVLTTQEAGNASFSDLKQLEFANKEKRVVITSDEDYPILSSKGCEHKGIIFITDIYQSIGETVRKVEKIISFMSEKDMENHVEFV